MGKDLNDESVLRLLRFGNTSFTTTFEQTTYDTQLSIERGVIWLIHAVEWHLDHVGIETPAASSQEYVTGQITRESKAAAIEINDADLISRFTYSSSRGAAIGTDAGPIVNTLVQPFMHVFPMPIPYAGANIFFGAISSFTEAKLYGRIHYSIATVTDKYFYRVASALVG